MICERCHQNRDNETDFYKSKRGKIDICKYCVRELVNDNDTKTFIPFLKQLDIPYVPYEYTRIKNLHPEQKTIFGRYVNFMQLKSFRAYGFEDSEELNEIYKYRNQRQNYFKNLDNSD